MGEPQQAVDIGDISELRGSAQILRDKSYEANLEFAIQSNDEAITKDGRMAITFLDKSTVKLTEHSQFCLLYTSPSPRDGLLSRMPSSA